LKPTTSDVNVLQKVRIAGVKIPDPGPDGNCKKSLPEIRHSVNKGDRLKMAFWRGSDAIAEMPKALERVIF